jgi:hypothetical protein
MDRERSLNDLVEKLKKALDSRLVSVVLYGSAAAGGSADHYSDVNVLCVLIEVTPAELADSASVLRWWRELGNPSPLLMSRRELATSADSFPIEFHDIQECNRLLFGEDLLAGLTIDRGFYRAQVEHELRAKLFRLRQKATGVLNEKDLLLRLLVDSVSTFTVLARHALILSGAGAHWRKREVVAAAARTLGLDAVPFDTLLDVREGKRKPREVEPGPLLANYLKEIQVLVEAVDRLSQ